ncbi:hypothetical protein HMI56_007428, partial [Coelomomyces lativittatus]
DFSQLRDSQVFDVPPSLSCKKLQLLGKKLGWPKDKILKYCFSKDIQLQRHPATYKPWWSENIQNMSMIQRTL